MQTVMISDQACSKADRNWSGKKLVLSFLYKEGKINWCYIIISEDAVE
jgi:hypothetical protein